MSSQTPAFLVEVSVEKNVPAPFVMATGQQCRAATLRGRSALPDLCFTETVHVAGESLLNIERLQRHGSVVVGLSERWEFEYDPVGGWFQHILNEAIRIVSTLPESSEKDESMGEGFDEALAVRILKVLKRIYPALVPSPMNLKQQLDNKPDDLSLMTALDALLGDGLITGKPLREHTTAGNRLAMLANIQITREGRQSLEPAAPSPSPVAIIHGDHFVNYGNLGAAGRGSSGTVEIRQSWSQKDAISALDALLSRLKEIPAQTPDLERAQREFHKVRDEIADEPQPDGSSLTKWLSRGKQLLATAALSQEVFEAAHSVYKLFEV